MLDFCARFTYNSSVLVGSAFVAIWEDPEGCFYQIRNKKSFKRRPNTLYVGETSSYSLLQQGVRSVTKGPFGITTFFFHTDNLKNHIFDLIPTLGINSIAFLRFIPKYESLFFIANTFCSTLEEEKNILKNLIERICQIK